MNIFVPIISLFFFGITLIIITLLAYMTAQTVLVNFPTVDGLPTAMDKILNIYKIYDYVALTLSIIFIIGIGATSYRLRTRPIFYIITLVTAAFYGFIAYVLSYMFSIFVSDPVFVVILYIFPLMILLLTNLHWVAIVMILVGAITFFSNNSNEEIPLR